MDKGSKQSHHFTVIILLVVGVLITPTVLVSGQIEASTLTTDTNTSEQGNNNNNAIMSSSSSKSSGSKDSITKIQAKNTEQSIYNCATGQKGVIITPGNFKFDAEKKGGKWHGTISIIGSTGQKSGHVTSATSSGITYAFKGNLNTENTLCHFPGLQLSGTNFDLRGLTCGTLKNVKYTEISTGNTNHFKALITCK